MKKQSSDLFTAISTEQTENLTREVKETLAFEHTHAAKTFTTTDLWNIHRQRRSLSSRRQFV